MIRYPRLRLGEQSDGSDRNVAGVLSAFPTLELHLTAESQNLV